MTAINRSLIKKILLHTLRNTESDLDIPRVIAFLEANADPLDLITAVTRDLRRSLSASADPDLWKFKQLPAADMLQLIKHLKDRAASTRI